MLLVRGHVWHRELGGRGMRPKCKVCRKELYKGDKVQHQNKWHCIACYLIMAKEQKIVICSAQDEGCSRTDCGHNYPHRSEGFLEKDSCYGRWQRCPYYEMKKRCGIVTTWPILFPASKKQRKWRGYYTPDCGSWQGEGPGSHYVRGWGAPHR